MSYQFGGASFKIEAWAFEVGQCIDHKDGNMISLVFSRMWTGKKEVYGVRAVFLADPQRDRVIEGASLTGTHQGNCIGCRFYKWKRCRATLAAC